MTILSGTYEWRLVAVSVLIAILTSGAALDLAGRLTAARGRARAVWLGGGAFAMGLGIWSMHYTGMLAFRLPVAVRYHVFTVAMSLVAAIGASVVALYLASRDRLRVRGVILGSVAMGTGIAAMHYVGMAAMRLPGMMQWDPWLVAASIAIAIGASLVALLLAFRHGHREQWTWRKFGSMLLMGAAIPGMHYTGMAAATIAAADAPVDLTGTVAVSLLGAQAIAAGTLVVMFAAIGTSVLDRWIGAERLRTATLLREERGRLARAQEIAHVGSWEMDIASNRVAWSDEAYRMYGVPIGARVGYDVFSARLHPDDRAWVEKLVAEGLTQSRSIEYEYRIVRTDGSVRHILGRNIVMADSTGAPVRLCGTTLDITDRKLAEEKQADLVKELQSALAEVRTLQGLIRICATCKRVLNDKGSWEQFESYVRGHSEVEFSHGMCPECARNWRDQGVT